MAKNRHKISDLTRSNYGIAICAVILCSFVMSVACKKRIESDAKGIGSLSSRQDGACGASGTWTETAFQKADALLKTINAISDRAECKALANIGWKLTLIKSLTTNPSEIDYRVARFMTLPREISSLTTFMHLGASGAQKSALLGQAQQALMSRVVELKSAESDVLVQSNLASSLDVQGDGTVNVTREMEGLYARLLTTGKVGLTNLDELFTVMSNSQDCIGKMGVVQSEFLLNSAQMLGAFASADAGVASQIGGTVNKYIKFVNSMYRSKIIQSNNESQLRETMSCLMDLVSYSYCGARDAKVLLDRGLERTMKGEAWPAPVYDSSNAFYGLDVLTNQVPTINKWLLQITQGIAMRNNTNATLLAGLMEIPIDLVAYRKEQDKSFDKAMYSIAGLTDEKARVTAMSKLLDSLGWYISTAKFPRRKRSGHNAETEIPNLLDPQGKSYRIPFILGGLKEELIPKAAIPGDPAAVSGVLNLAKVVASQGPLESMASFELFRSTVRQNLTAWQNSAATYGMNYFWKNYPIDYLSIAGQASSGFRITPIEAFQSVRSYLLHFLQLAKNTQLTSFQVNAPVVIEQIKKLDTIINAYQALSENSSLADAENFVKLIYQQLEMVIFSETLIQERLQPLVILEINAMMAGQIPGKNNLEANIVNVAEKTAVMNLFARAGLTPGDGQKVSVDIASSMTMSQQVLEALETIVGNPLEDNLIKMQKRAKGLEWNADAVREDSYRRSIRNTLAISGSDISDRYQDRFSPSYIDWLLLVQPRAALRRSMNPDLYPMPAAGGFRGFTDDENGSFATMWGFLCAQSLSLSNRERYRKICSGSSFGVDAPKNLPGEAKGEIKLVYDQWWSDWDRKHKSRSGWNGEDPICTTYDLQRRWKIYYMSLDQFTN